MDTHHQNEQKQPLDEQILQELIDGRDGAATVVPVVRSNTPRPLSFARPASKGEQASERGGVSVPADFPGAAPVAPPLPEESEESGNGTAVVATTSIAQPITSEKTGTPVAEFTWLFEYGLEMDEDYLNSSTRLNGQAYIYGPAVLKGYRIESITLQSGQTAITIASAPASEQEVWGILYRIPRKLSEKSDSEPSVLDLVHATYPSIATPVTVLEMYRKRPVQCVTYMLSEAARKSAPAFSPPGVHLDHSYARRLVETARRHKLPEAYLKELALLSGQQKEEPSTPTPIRAEQNTEPLPVLTASTVSERLPAIAQNTTSTPTPSGWLLALALYLVALLLATLALAVAQALGYWNTVFTASFAPLGAPWYVLLYGLLGGCISCIMTLGRPTRPTWPGFVILTWFARPFLGAVLAALVYLVLSSGLFAMSAVPAQRYAIFSVVGAIAGLCEGWLFFRQK
ncbi:MAG TPA: gamma-glutamylcyclotransferase [Ktedonobacteraceae bacterium]|nr:gamma-glutamylcyclotransferase [Ktedonobacteraceae bacterium]